MIKDFYINHAMLKDISTMNNEELLYSIELINICLDNISKVNAYYKKQFISRQNLLKSIYKGRKK